MPNEQHRAWLARRVRYELNQAPELPLKDVARLVRASTGTISHDYHAARRVM